MTRAILYVFLIAAEVPAATLSFSGGASAPALSLSRCVESKRTGTVSGVLTTAGAAAEIPVALRAIFRAADGTVIAASNATAPPGAQTPLSTRGVSWSMTFEGCTPPASGTLVAQTGMDAPVTSDISIRPALDLQCGARSPWPGWKWLALGGPMVAALGVVIFMIAFLRKDLTRRMGSFQFDFTSSWAVNATVAGSVLGGIVGVTVFPDQGRFLNKSEYMALIVVIPVIALFSPWIYNLFRKAEPDPNPANPSGVQYQGYVIMFLLAAGVTCWGSLTQITVLALSVQELSCTGSIPPYLAGTLTTLALLICAGLLVYVGNTGIFTASHQVQHGKNLKAAMAPAAPVNPPLPRWNVL